MKRLITIGVIIFILGLAVVVAMASGAGRLTAVNTDKEVFDYSDSWADYETPLPVTEFSVLQWGKSENKGFPSKEQLKIIGRMADGIASFKISQGGWWECGEHLTDASAIKDRAAAYAFVIVKAAWEVSDPVENETPFVLNPWGMAGTIFNESKFDRCALGAYPRKVAYEIGLLKRSKLTLSHKEEDVLRVVRSKEMAEYFKHSGFDLGATQLLSRFWDNPRDFETMISLQGIEFGAQVMMRRGRFYKTDRPWLYWPGKKSDWYDAKVKRWAKLLGARDAEI